MKTKLSSRLTLVRCIAMAAVIATAFTSAWARDNSSYLRRLNKVVQGPSTVPANGDVNPYGVAQIRVNSGMLVAGNFLVSNFNNGANQQGTGTTIVQITPGRKGKVITFAQINAALPGCPGGVGLTTALAVVGQFVIVGSLPTQAGDATTASAGCLIFLDNNGSVRATFSGNGINGPWDGTLFEDGPVVFLYLTNVLNGTLQGTSANVSSAPPTKPLVVNGGTVLRLAITIRPFGLPQLNTIVVTEIGSGFAERLDPAALVIGPTGLAYDPRHDVLYVADTVNNRIAAIDHAEVRSDSANTGRTVSQGRALNGPLGMTLAPNGNIITANGGDGRLVETTPRGRQVATKLVDKSGSPRGAGALFGLQAANGVIYFVDDATNTFNVLK